MKLSITLGGFLGLALGGLVTFALAGGVGAEPGLSHGGEPSISAPIGVAAPEQQAALQSRAHRPIRPGSDRRGRYSPAQS